MSVNKAGNTGMRADGIVHTAAGHLQSGCVRIRFCNIKFVKEV